MIRNMKSLTWIYGLVDPRDGQVRYIGMTTKTLEARLAGHLNESHYRPKLCYHKSHWIRQLVALGLSPGIQLLEEVLVDDDWRTAEIRWIAYGRSQGWPLTNMTDGGEGAPGRVLSEETKRRIAIAAKGRPSPKKGKPVPLEIAQRQLKPMPRHLENQFGKLSDREIAAQCGLTARAVGLRREKLGIPPKPRVEWPDWAIAELGKSSDLSIANRLGCSHLTVAKKRASLGIPLPQRLRDRWTSDVVAKLGMVPDSAIAAELGCSQSAVSAYRNSLGIPANYGRKNDHT